MSSVALVLTLLVATPGEAGAPLQASPTSQEAPPPSPAEAPPAPEPVREVPEKAASDDDLVVTGRSGPPKGDPLEKANLVSFEATQAVDRAIIRPVAKTYQKILPDPLRSGIRNVINNLREPVAVLNFLLQLKPGKAVETAGRFALNTTVGAAGLFDIAKRKPFNLPRRPNGLANTLGFYGVKPGPFLFLPLVGPTTLRDVIGDGLDRLVLPLAVGKPFNRPVYATAIYVFSSLDQRAEFDEKLEELHSDKIDPYSATREDYLRSRQAAIDALKGKKTAPAKVEEHGEGAPESPAAAGQQVPTPTP